MRYASACDGIGAVHCAWQPLGWECAWTSELDPFPASVAEQRWGFPNLGDMTAITDEKLHEHGPINVLVGGTPCQSFSVAGLRAGLADPRGNLALSFLGLARRTRAEWVVWENVPGVLSSTSGEPAGPPPNRMGVGHGERVVDMVEYDETSDFDCFIAGLEELGYGVAYRVLDAQHFGVPQRRRRVFVVGYLGDWRRAAAVLFERACLSGNPAPSREEGEAVAALSASGVGTCGADDNQAQGGHIVEATVSPPLMARDHKGPTSNVDGQPLIAHSLRGEGFDASEDGTGRGVPLTVQSVALRGRSEGGTAHVLVGAVAFSCKDSGGDAGRTAPTLRAMGHAASHENGGGQVAVCFDETQITSAENRSNPQPCDPSHPLAAGARPPTLAAPAVRRLTPMECCRLQGLPDHYTLIDYRGKTAADSPRYKAIGNSMPVPVMAWIGERIDSCAVLRFDDAPEAQQAALL